MSSGGACRRGSDPTLLWLWCRSVTIVLIRSQALEPAYATGVALKRQKKFGVPIVAQWLTNPTKNHEVVGSIPCLAQSVKDPALL